MKDPDMGYTDEEPHIYSYGNSCINPLFAEFCGASYVSALPKLAGPLHAIAFGGIRKEFIKTDLCFISLDFK
jgi:hypothetical protein